MQNSIKYVDVILPLPLADYYTYHFPENRINEIQIGCRVIVSFGKKKFYTAIVIQIHSQAPSLYSTKEITAILENNPIVTEKQLDLWKWIASYYQCTLGEVYKAALPAGLKLESETIVCHYPNYEKDETITVKEQKVLEAFYVKEKMTLAELERISGIKNVLPIVRVLLEKEALFVNEILRNTYKTKTETYIRLAEQYTSENALHDLFDKLSKIPKQEQILMCFLELSCHLLGEVTEVSKKDLFKVIDISPTSFNGLIKKGIFETYTKDVGRLKIFPEKITILNSLNDLQQRAYNEIIQSFENKNITLLHGVTSSGKTEVYIHLISEMLKQGKQVLYLLPEIALTTQITERMSRIFGNKLCVYHSKFSDNERVEIWNNLLQNKGCEIVLGVRSSVFLPFRNLGLIIVDEEHESTFKQYDPAPRYHAKNTAMILADMYHAKVLLGTATPSIESYFHAKNGKYGLVEMLKRFEEIEMPNIGVVNTGILYKRKQMISHFSPFLLQKMREALELKEQVILFQNRRGFAPMIECKLCAWVPKCKNCDVSLTYHKYTNQLTCHYCGYASDVPQICPVCQQSSLTTKGFGTEKIEEEIADIFPQATIARMDLDTTRTRSSYEKIIANVETGKTDILIGTQMISKGLDFDNISIVGILNADTMINYPDFRSHERAFQLMAQVAGRAGRKRKRGMVILQTSNPDHSIIQKVKKNDYIGMFNEQIAERQMFHYPPFTRLINIIIKHQDQKIAENAAKILANSLRKIFGNRILGPDKPIIERIQTYYIQKIVLKIEINTSMGKIKELLNIQRIEMLQEPSFKSVYVYYDVDPV